MIDSNVARFENETTNFKTLTFFFCRTAAVFHSGSSIGFRATIECRITRRFSWSNLFAIWFGKSKSERLKTKWRNEWNESKLLFVCCMCYGYSFILNHCSSSLILRLLLFLLLVAFVGQYALPFEPFDVGIGLRLQSSKNIEWFDIDSSSFR